MARGLLSEADAEDMLTYRGTGGFSLDGSVRIGAHDRAGLERLLRGHRREALVVLVPPRAAPSPARSLARALPQTELIAVDPPSPWDRASRPAPGRDPFDQSLSGDDGTWCA